MYHAIHSIYIILSQSALKVLRTVCILIAITSKCLRHWITYWGEKNLKNKSGWIPVYERSSRCPLVYYVKFAPLLCTSQYETFGIWQYIEVHNSPSVWRVHKNKCVFSYLRGHNGSFRAHEAKVIFLLYMCISPSLHSVYKTDTQRFPRTLEDVQTLDWVWGSKD